MKVAVKKHKSIISQRKLKAKIDNAVHLSW